MKISKNRIPA